MFERMSNSFALAQSSWGVLRENKRLLIFPVVSGIACLLVMASFAVPVGILAMNDQLVNDQGQLEIWVYPVMFAYYFCSYFVIVFCNAALISCALVRFSGEEPTVGGGFSAAASRLPQILAWALVSATVGVLLRVIESLHEKAGAIVSAVLGTAWTVITYFVIPVLVVEKVGPIDAVKRSLSLLRRTWGEALIGNIGLGLFMFLLALPGVALLILGGYVASNLLAVGLGLMAVALVYFLIVAAVSSAMNTIFLGALYQYAAFETVPAGFEQGTLERAFTHKK